MARLLFAWELGGGLGHVTPLAQLARPLLARGHELHLVLRDLSVAGAALGGLAASPRLRLWQAPVWLPPLQGQPPAASYAELLFAGGYLDGTRLRSLVLAWRALLDAIAPDLLLADHAPSALLAARGRPLRRVLLGQGFFQPPAAAPMPSFREWEAVDARRLAQSEAHALAQCQRALAGDDVPAMTALHQLLDADESWLLAWPEFDPYGDARRAADAGGPAPGPAVTCWGPLPAPGGGEAPVWPGGGGAPLLAYLKGDYAGLQPVLSQLRDAPWRTLAHVPGLTAAQRQGLASPRLRFSDGALDMPAALAQARGVLCHAGAGTVDAALQAGVPVLALPMQAEQLLRARRLAATGAGALLRAPELASGLRPALARLLDQPAQRDAAAALARRHAAPAGQAALSERLGDRCEALLAGGGAGRGSVGSLDT